MDDWCDPAGGVAVRAGQLLHAWRLHPSPPGHGRGRDPHASSPRSSSPPLSGQGTWRVTERGVSPHQQRGLVRVGPHRAWRSYGTTRGPHAPFEARALFPEGKTMPPVGSATCALRRSILACFWCVHVSTCPHIPSDGSVSPTSPRMPPARVSGLRGAGPWCHRRRHVAHTRTARTSDAGCEVGAVLSRVLVASLTQARRHDGGSQGLACREDGGSL